jgi:hypothetical protein
MIVPDLGIRSGPGRHTSTTLSGKNSDDQALNEE